MSAALKITVADADDRLAVALAALPGSLGIIRDFPPEAAAEAESAARSPRLPDLDRTDLPLITIDPAGSRDLDQALLLERDGGGFHVRYAIADLTAFITPGGALDLEAHRRGQTLYPPDGRIPLHPAVLSEGAASLLPGEARPAYLWDIRLDDAGNVVDRRLDRAIVRSVRRMSYREAQDEVDRGVASASLALLPEIGTLRQRLEQARGGADLGTTEVEIEKYPSGYRLERRAVLPLEDANAQLSLLTGIVAAQLMLDGQVGILRTMPPADPEWIEHFRRRTVALGHPWLTAQPYGAYLAELSGTDPHDLAIRHAAASLFRGAGYAAFDGRPPATTIQAAVAAPYAHVTAPLRRLVDRYTLAVCAALSSGEPVPDWARAALPDLPRTMATSGNLAGRLDRLALDTVEAAILAPRIGEEFDAVVLGSSATSSTVQLLDPAVEATCAAPFPPGSAVRVRLAEADIETARVAFSPSGAGPDVRRA